MKRHLLAFILSGLACVLLSGCNTIEGIGKDVKKAGEKVEDAARN